MQNLGNRLASRVAGIQRRAAGASSRQRGGGGGGSGASFGELAARLSRASKLVNQSRGAAAARRP